MNTNFFITSRKAFSLIELMVVISIIGILSAVAVPSYKTYIAKSRAGSMLAEIALIQTRITDMFNQGATTPIVATTFTAAPFNYASATIATANVASVAYAAAPTAANCTGTFAGSTAIAGLTITGTAAANSLVIYMNACLLNDTITWVCGSAAANLPSLPTSCQSTFTAP